MRGEQRAQVSVQVKKEAVELAGVERVGVGDAEKVEDLFVGVGEIEY